MYWGTLLEQILHFQLFKSLSGLPGAAMPASLLWAVDVHGRIYSLSSAGQQWELWRDAPMEFKRVTAAQQCCWSLGCDNGIYLNVFASDVPVRYREETYENQVCLKNKYICTLSSCFWSSSNQLFTLQESYINISTKAFQCPNYSSV